MKHRLKTTTALALLGLGLAAAPVLADDDCDAPVERWQPRDAVREMAVREGWQIQRLKIDDGCYEIRGTDAQGRSFKAKLDPETLKVVKMKRRDRERDRERQRERDREPAQDQPMAPGGGAATSPVFTPGTAPRGQIE
jgi:hypothetical protein